MNDLHADMLAAHAAGDTDALVTLYSAAARGAADVDAACFFLTHAYVFALERGDARAGPLRAQLVAHGRETPDQPARSAA
jgi:hypothetical protein